MEVHKIRRASSGVGRWNTTVPPWVKYIQDYHGQAQITGLIPNQMFVNKLFAMSQISLHDNGLSQNRLRQNEDSALG